MEDLIYSQSIKAGKRIYYIDVKKSRRDDMYLTITESKKVIVGTNEEQQISFEKHKVFLYKEDFEKFMCGMKQAINFIEGKQYTSCLNEEYKTEKTEFDISQPKIESSNEILDGDIKIELDF